MFSVGVWAGFWTASFGRPCAGPERVFWTAPSYLGGGVAEGWLGLAGSATTALEVSAIPAEAMGFVNILALEERKSAAEC